MLYNAMKNTVPKKRYRRKNMSPVGASFTVAVLVIALMMSLASTLSFTSAQAQVLDRDLPITIEIPDPDLPDPPDVREPLAFAGVPDSCLDLNQPGVPGSFFDVIACWIAAEEAEDN
jgi:hypothetical protein